MNIASVGIVEKEEVVPNVKIAKEEKSETAKEMLERVLNEVGLNSQKFSDKAITKILENYDEELIRKNVNLLKEKKMKIDLTVDNYELLYDKELKEKVEKLLEIGKEIQDICLMPSVLIKYDLMV